MVLAAYENIAALLAVAETHRRAAREAEEMALASLSWVLAHPEAPEWPSVRELRRLIATRAGSAISQAG